jgi:1-deoxy-D-xylulose-5-phosphate synthase
VETPAAVQTLLDRLDDPAQLRELTVPQLQSLSDELRQYLISSVASCGGHLAAGLGAVELTIALHYCFDTPRDSLVWDVGHQGYPHKVLTGRRDRLTSIRRRGGLSGFLRREESVYDSFGAGHSSTSISAALGIAIANARLGESSKSVAIIGDGGMTAGLAYEALDHAGALDVDLMVVLNDNRMSISPNVGAMCRYLARLLSSRGYASMREGGRRFLARLPRLLELADRAERQLKGMVVPGQLFEELGFAYFGPVDGHDLPGLVRVLDVMRQQTGPRLLHVVTHKGNGYAPAVADPVKYHGVTPFDPAVGIAGAAKPAATFTQVFGDWLCETAAVEPQLVAITPAMSEGSGLVEFAARFPDRYFDVGIAEQHSVTFAAGLASRGLKPVVAIYSTFLQRAYDQLIHDVAIQNLPVLFAIDRGGLVGPDGATHNGSFDLSYLRCIPGLVIMAPSDGAELRDMLHTGFHLPGPVAVRYPRTSVPDAGVARRATQRLPLATAELRRQGSSVVMLVFGTLLPVAMAVAEQLDATVVNMRFIKPLDRDMVLRMAGSHDLVVTLEENAIAGGAGSAVGECLAAAGVTVSLLNLGLPDRYPEHGTRDEVLKDVGLDAAGILAAIGQRLKGAA